MKQTNGVRVSEMFKICDIHKLKENDMVWLLTSSAGHFSFVCSYVKRILFQSPDNKNARVDVVNIETGISKSAHANWIYVLKD